MPHIDAIWDWIPAYLLNPIFPKFFRDDADCAPLQAHLDATTVDMPPFDERRPSAHVRAQTRVGALTASYRVVRWRGAGFPTVIFHHGTGEIGGMRAFHMIFTATKRKHSALNLIAVCAPWHDSIRAFCDGNRSAERWAAMMATSVHLIEALIRHLRPTLRAPIAVSGLSLGGYVANLHNLRFGSADKVFPLLGGAQLGDVFLDSALTKLVARAKADANADAIRAAFNYGDALTPDHLANTYALLARDDQLVKLDRELPVYRTQPVRVLPGSHVTCGVRDGETMYQHIVERM